MLHDVTYFRSYLKWVMKQKKQRLSSYQRPTTAKRFALPVFCVSVHSLFLFLPKTYVRENFSVNKQSYVCVCDPMDCSPPGSSVHGISQARVLEWVAVSFSRVLSDSGIVPGCRFFAVWATREATIRALQQYKFCLKIMLKY